MDLDADSITDGYAAWGAYDTPPFVLKPNDRATALPPEGTWFSTPSMAPYHATLNVDWTTNRSVGRALTSTDQPRGRDTHCAEPGMLACSTAYCSSDCAAYDTASAEYRYTTTVAAEDGAPPTVESARTSSDSKYDPGPQDGSASGKYNATAPNVEAPSVTTGAVAKMANERRPVLSSAAEIGEGDGLAVKLTVGVCVGVVDGEHVVFTPWRRRARHGDCALQRTPPSTVTELDRGDARLPDGANVVSPFCVSALWRFTRLPDAHDTTST